MFMIFGSMTASSLLAQAEKKNMFPVTFSFKKGVWLPVHFKLRPKKKKVSSYI